MKANKELSGSYIEARESSETMGDRNCCAVIAVALLAGKEYRVVFNVFRRLGRKRGRGTPRDVTWAALRHFGFELRRMSRLPKTVNRCEGKLAKRGKYLIHTSRHCLAYINGTVHDHSRGSRRRPIAIFKVVRARKKK